MSDHLGIGATVLTMVLAAGAGCGSRAQQSRAQAMPPAGATGTSMGMGSTAMACPAAVPGTQTAVLDTPGGAGLAFTTERGDVNELRRRVHAMAGMHGGQYAGTTGARGGGPGMQAGTAQAGSMGVFPPGAQVRDIENGAQIHWNASDPQQVDTLRHEVKVQAMRMHSSVDCQQPDQGLGGTDDRR